MSKLLITAFEPFGGEPENASQAVLDLLPSSAGAWSIAKAVLPVVYDGAALYEALRREKPDAVLAMGQAGGAEALRLERFARNLMDCAAADQRGRLCQNETIAAGGAWALEATLPLEAMAAAMATEALPVCISRDAGGYVCNYTLYQLLGFAAENGGFPAGFLHLPFTESQQVRHPAAFAACAQAMARAVLRGIAVL